MRVHDVRLRNVACRSDGDQHLILPHREIEDLSTTGFVKLCEHIIENHDRLAFELCGNRFI